MLQLEVLVSELLAVNAFATRTVTVCEITTLNHETGDDTMEDGALVMKRLAGLANTLLTGTQSTEILNSLRNSLTEST